MVQKCLYVSKVEKFTLEEACILQQELCHSRHASTCTDCTCLTNICYAVVKEGLTPLADMYKQYCPGKMYVSTKAVRFLMSMPVVIMEIGKPGRCQLYVMPKVDTICYVQMHKHMQHLCTKERSTGNTNGLSKDMLRSICTLASTQKDSMLMKYIACAASGKGSKKGKKDYGFEDFNKKHNLIQESLKQANELREAIDHLATTEDVAVLSTFGIQNICEDSDEDEKEEVNMGTTVWDSDSDDSLDSEVCLPEIESEDEDMSIINSEQQLYQTGASTIDDRCKELIRKKRAYIRRKAHRKFLKECANHCLLKRKVPNRVSQIITAHPNIGKDVEEFVTNRQMGADAWRRTGVTTFDGNSKV